MPDSFDTAYVHTLYDSINNNIESFDIALEFANKALNISDNIQYERGIAQSYMMIGNVYYRNEQFKKAIDFFWVSLSEFHELDDFSKVVDLFDFIGIAYYMTGDYRQAIHNFEKGLKISDSLNNESSKANFLNKIGACYDFLEKDKKALESYFASLNIFEKLGEREESAIVLVNFGIIYGDQKNFDKALEYYKKALDIFYEFNNQDRISVCLNNLGAIYYDMENYIKAIEYFERSLILDKELQNEYGVSICLNNIGDCYMQLNEESRAIDYLTRALKLSKEIDNKQIISVSLYNLSLIEQKNGNYLKAIKFGERSRDIAKLSGSATNILNACELLSIAYSATGQYEKAYNCLNNYHLLSDSIFTSEKNKQILEIQAKYEDEKQKLEIQSLKKENEHQAKRKKILVTAVITSTFLVIALLLFIFYIRKSKNRLQIQKKYFETLIANSEDYIIVVDDNAKMKYISPSYEKRIGRKIEDRIGNSALEYIHPDDKGLLQKNLKKALTTKSLLSFEFRAKNVSGEWMNLIAYAKNLLDDPDINGIVINVWDISDRKYYEKLILEKQKEIEQSQKLAKLGSWKLDVNIGTLTLSKELMLLLGEENKEISVRLDEFIAKYFVEEDIPLIYDKLDQAKENINSLSYKERLEARAKTFNPSGIIHIEMWGEFIEHGIIHGVTQDITEKREAEKQIFEAEKKYQNIYNAFQDVYYKVNNDNIIVEVSPSVTKVGGYLPEEVIGIHVSNFFLSEEAWQSFLSTIHKKNEVRDFNIQLLAKDGSIVNCSLNAKVLYDNNKKKTGIEGVLRDISDRRRVELALKESEKKYHDVFNAFIDVYYQLSMDGTILEITPSVNNYIGYTREELLGTYIGELYPKDMDHALMYKELAIKKQVTDYDIVMLTNNNRKINCAVTARVLYDEKGKPLMIEGIVRDISDRIKTHKILEKSEKELKISNETKDKILSIIGHDLLGPIGINKSMTDLIVDEKDKLTKDEIVELITSLKPAMDSNYIMVENILSWARLQKEKITFKPEPAYLKPLIDENFALFSIHVKSKSIELFFKGLENLSANFDKNQILIVIRNLISNAIKYTDKGGQVVVDMKENNGFAEVSVSDTGIGISKEKLSGIFKDSVKKESRVGTDNEKGTGLGLVIVKEFVKLNKGTIKVESEEGTGTTFTFTLPLVS